MPENNSEEIKYSFLSPEHLIGEEVFEVKKEAPEKKELKIERHELPSSAPLIKTEIEKPVKEGKEKIVTPPFKYEELKVTSQSQPFVFKPSIQEKTTIEAKLKVINEEVEESKRKISFPQFSFSLNLKIFLPIFLGLIGVILIVFLFIKKDYFQKFLVQNEERKIEEELILPKEELKEPEFKTQEINLPSKTSSEIELPTPPPEDVKKETTLSIKEKTEISSLNFQASLGISNFSFLPFREIRLSNLDEKELTEKLKNFFLKQETSGFLINLEIISNGKRVPFSFIRDYFLKPSFTQDKSFFYNNFGEKYNLLIYYSLTRKHPILIVEVKNPNLIKEFNEKWEKNSLIKDIATFFIDYPLGKLIKNFSNKEINKVQYRVAYFENNSSFYWLLYNNYVIYGTNENSLEEVLSYLK